MSTTAYDLCIVTDATGSMGTFLYSIRESLQQILHMVRVVECIDRIGVLAYYDYCDDPITRWSGWKASANELEQFVKGLEATGGGDWPEAAKTAAVELLTHVTKPTLVVWYADAPPHHARTDSSNFAKERAKLGADFDWVRICRAVAAARVRVFPIFTAAPGFGTTSFYTLLATATGGCFSQLPEDSARAIARHTIGLFLTMIGQPYEFGGAVRRHSYLNAPDMAALGDENSCQEYLLSIQGDGDGNGNYAMDEVLVPEHIAKLEVQTDSLAKRFELDKAFRTTVYEIFSAVLNPDQIEALTYNPVFGTLWRALCKRRNDDRRDWLINKMGETVSVLGPELKERLKAYLEESYDQGGAIAEMVGKFEAHPAFVLDAAEQLPRGEMLEVSRSCHPAVLAKVGQLLTGLREAPDGPLPEQYIPAAMPARDIFALLPHLMAPGTMFSLRPAAIMAVMAVYTGSILRERGLEFLEAWRGRWIDTELPENCSLEFVKLVLRVPECLTTNELQHFTRLKLVGGLNINGRTNVDVRVGYTSNKTLRPDRKAACTSCRRARSFTLIAADGVCGLCHAHPDGKDTENEPDGKNASHWCECSTCNAHYAVVRVADLNVRPKCHFCRAPAPPAWLRSGMREPAPGVNCGRCRNRFLLQNEALLERCGGAEGFVCPPCEAKGGALLEEQATTVRDYLRENGPGFLGLKIADLDAFFEARSLAKCKDGAEVVAAETPWRFLWRGKHVHNADEVRQTISGWIERGQAEQGTCMLCYGDVPKAALGTVCGQRACQTQACTPCLIRWYGAVRPGALCLPPNLACPFCKHEPSLKVLKLANRQLCELRRTAELQQLDPAWYHAWCLGCYAIKPALEKVCAEGIPEMTAFMCEPCAAAARARDSDLAESVAAPPIDARLSPCCGVMVQKTSGCDHISCQCGKHWCWACTKSFAEDKIYGHMYVCVYGGIGINGAGQGDESDEEY